MVSRLFIFAAEEAGYHPALQTEVNCQPLDISFRLTYNLVMSNLDTTKFRDDALSPATEDYLRALYQLGRRNSCLLYTSRCV